MTKNYNADIPYIEADADKVLCDGETMTSIGGRVYSKDTDMLDADWQEMLPEEAEALVAANSEEEAGEADYQAALAELGVQLNEEA